jgi:hypothetical protein
MTAVRWGLVAAAGGFVTLMLTALAGVSFLGVLLSYGLGLFLLPVPLTVGAGFVALGGVMLERAHVVRPHVTAWLTAVVLGPVLALGSVFVPVEVIGAHTPEGETNAVLWVIWMVLLSAGLGAAAWCAVVALFGPDA